MLELKRKVKQGVRIGASLRATLAELLPRNAVFHVNAPGLEFELHLKVGSVTHVLVDGYALEVHMVAIERGEAVLGFEASRNLRIDRAEVVSRENDLEG